jgi:hypothetical protein
MLYEPYLLSGKHSSLYVIFHLNVAFVIVMIHIAFIAITAYLVTRSTVSDAG